MLRNVSECHIANVPLVIKGLAHTGEEARPAEVSTRRALLQTGPALLGGKLCHILMQ